MCRLCSFHDVVGGKFFLLRNQDFLPRSLPFCLKISGIAVKLEADRDSLRAKLKDLKWKDAEIRLKLRKNDGHKGKVNKKVLDWIDLAGKLHLESMTLIRVFYIYEYQGCCQYVYLKADRCLLKLIHEVDILVESASSLVIYEHVPVLTRTDFVLNLAPKVLEELWDSLMDPRIGIIGLYGYGGVGKTTIVKNIVDQLELASTETFDNIIWVTLSKNVNWERVRDDIAMQLRIDLPALRYFSPRWEDMETDKKKKRNIDWGLMMSEHLRNVKRCLFIIDDMWAPIPHYDILEDQTDNGMLYHPDSKRPKHTIPQSFRHTIIPEPTEDNGCKVVITTRDQSVCEEMGAYKQIYLAPLSQKEAWDLFVIQCGDHALDVDIQSIAREVADECGGLSLNIITIGHFLRGESNAAAWKLALMDLQKTRRGISYDKFYHLRFCYNRLKNDQIRKCFLYCGVFPENYKFKSKELIEYWMAEDYIYIEGDRIGTINLGKEILRELKDSNMLEMFVEDGNDCFKMHGLFRDLAINIARNECNFKVQAGQRLEEFPDYYKGLETHAKLISVIRMTLRNMAGMGGIHLSQLYC